MLEGIFRFWARLRYWLTGTSVIVVWALIFFGNTFLGWIYDAISNQSVPELVIIIGISAGVISIGIETLELIISILAFFTTHTARSGRIANFLARIHLESVAFPTGLIVLNLFHKHQKVIISFYELKSQALPNNFDKAKELDIFYSKVKRHFAHKPSSRLITTLAYENTVTQEQQKIEMQNVRVAEARFLLLLFFSLPFLPGQIPQLENYSFSILILSTALFIAALYLLENRKVLLSYAYLTRYIGNFVVSEGAEVVDREAIF